MSSVGVFAKLLRLQTDQITMTTGGLQPHTVLLSVVRELCHITKITTTPIGLCVAVLFSLSLFFLSSFCVDKT